MKTKKEKLSINEVNSKIEKNPEEAYLYAARARYHRNNNQLPEAIEDYTKAINLDKSNYKQYYYLRAEVYYKNNNLDAAERDYITFLSSSPYSIVVRKKLINIYFIQNNVQELIDEFEDLIEIFEYYNKNIKRTFYGDMAKVMYKFKLYNKVIELINKEVLIIENSANYQLRAMAKFKIGDFEGALDDIKKVFKYNLENEETYKIKKFIESNLNLSK